MWQEIVPESTKKEVPVKKAKETDVVDDYEYSRAQLYNLVEGSGSDSGRIGS